MLWQVLQWLINIVLLGFMGFSVARLFRRPQEDPRLSRGLQLLQSKISVLEDLSDRTDHEVRQLMQILDHKVMEINQKLAAVDQKLMEVDSSIERSLETAQIFQDRIPHHEIIERRNTINYVKAARLAHQGMTLDQIATQVDLPRGELELLVKLNRSELMFSEENLPEWVKRGVESGADYEAADHAVEHPVEHPVEHRADHFTGPDMMRSMGEKFRQALNEFDFVSSEIRELNNLHQEEAVQVVRGVKPVRAQEPIEHAVSPLPQNAPSDSNFQHAEDPRFLAPTAPPIEAPPIKATPINKVPVPYAAPLIGSSKSDPVVRKVVFPKIQM